MDLGPIEKRADAATEGPWDSDDHSHGERGCRCLSCDVTTGWTLRHALTCHETDKAGEAYDGACEALVFSFEDAEFIAHAREDVPALVARVRELEEDNARLQDLADRRWVAWRSAVRRAHGHAAKARECEEETLHWAEQVIKAGKVLGRLAEQVHTLKAALARAAQFRFGAGVEVSREDYHGDGPVWFVRSWGPTERHAEQGAALERAQELEELETARLQERG